MYSLLKKVTTWVAFFAVTTVGAQQYTNASQTILLGSHCQILTDTTGSLSPQQAFVAGGYVNQSAEVPNLDISTRTYWVRFSLQNFTDASLLLRLAQPYLDCVELYAGDSNGKVSLLGKSGDYLPFSTRQNKFQDHVFALKLATNRQPQRYLLKIRSNEQIMLPLTAGSEQAIMADIMEKDSLFAAYAGIMLVMFLYNLFIWFSSRDKNYLYYVIYILAVALTQASLEGYAGRYLWGNLPVVNDFMVYFFSIFIGIMAMVFIKTFLRTKTESPKLHIGLNVFIGLYLGLFILFFAGQKSLTYQLILALAGLSAFYSLITGFYLLWVKKSRQARFFVYAWTFFIGCVVVYVLKDAGVMPYNLFTANSLQLGSGVEAIVLSIALADKINTLQKATIEAQAREFEAVKENGRIITEQNAMLEEKVKLRTRDLELAQAQLVNSEKMASLGQLTAGIAHEINNPINYVASSIKPLTRDVNDLVDIARQVAAMHEENVQPTEIANVKQKVAKLEHDQVFEELNDLITNIAEGATRTKEIVKGLKTFSRLDEAELKLADINGCIESTLVIVQSNSKHVVEFTFEKGQLPSIECFPGKLNQVIMNILNNSVQAIQAKNLPKGERGRIRVSTRVEEKQVLIQIEDNGIGMSDAVKQKMFDPFFTTKEVGEGTGLGLSIVYSILQSHKAETNVMTVEGEGTTFVIKLPANLGSLHKN